MGAELSDTAKAINTLADFCGKRDVRELTQAELRSRYGFPQADVFVLFGGSILEGGNVLARAMLSGIAKKYVIVGGEGHTTEALRQKMRGAFSHIETAGLPEAEVFAAFLQYKYALTADYTETRSTNCGNNITYLLELLREKQIDFHSIVLAQDATMQCRMEKTLRKHVSPDTVIINYATYRARVRASRGGLVYAEDIWGMWDMDRYISLLMGEITRLTDDESGYGPSGRDYIVHVDIPDAVKEAFSFLKSRYRDAVRAANPLYASK